MSATLPDVAAGDEGCQRGPFVPALPLVELVRRRYPHLSLAQVFEAHGLSVDLAYPPTTAARKRYSFGVADRIVTVVLDDAGLWERVPELAAVYLRLLD